MAPKKPKCPQVCFKAKHCAQKHTVYTHTHTHRVASHCLVTHPLSPVGKHTASTHRLSALVTPAGHSFVCQAQQTLTLISSDHQKGITMSMYDIQIQPFDIASDFVFSERKNFVFSLLLLSGVQGLQLFF